MLSLKSWRVSFKIYFMISHELIIVFGLIRTIVSYTLRSLNFVQKSHVPLLSIVLVL